MLGKPCLRDGEGLSNDSPSHVQRHGLVAACTRAVATVIITALATPAVGFGIGIVIVVIG